MFHHLKRAASGLFVAVLNMVFAMAVLGGQWFIASLAGDSALLGFELLVTIFSLGGLAWLINRADKLARVVGTVRRGSPQEKQADRVMARFGAADTVLEYLFYAFIPPAIAGFFLLDARVALYLHGALLVLAVGGAFWLAHRLDSLQKARGYTEDFGRTTP